MNGRTRLTVIILLTLAGSISLPAAAYGYGGPGSVISGVGAILAVIVAIGASIIGFIWFPLKRLARRLSALRVNDGPESEGGFPDELTQK